MRLNNIRAIVFDVDGTLYPQRALRMRMLFELAVQIGCKQATEFRTLKVLRSYQKAQELARSNSFGAGAAAVQLKIASDLSGEDPEFVERSVNEWFQQRPLRHLKSYLHPDLVSLLTEARKRGVRLGVVSDYPAKDKLRAMGIIDLFDAVISSHDETVGCLKPHPRGLQTCLQQLAVTPCESVYVGDRTDVDLRCAENAKTQFVLFGKASSRSLYHVVSTYRQLGHVLGLQASFG